MRKRIFIVSFAFIAGVTVGASSLALARGQSTRQPGQTFTITTDTAGKVLQSSERKPLLLDNEALGLRVVGRHDGRVVGTLMAKVDGKWVEVQFAPQDMRARE